MKKQFLEIGKIVNTHGIKGEMKLQLWCDDINFVKQFALLYADNKGEKPLKINSIRGMKNDALIIIDGINSIEDANKMRNNVLYINRDDAKIEDNNYFIQDIIDCKVIDIDNDFIYGVVTDVQNLGASDIYEVKLSNSSVVLMPAIKEIIKKYDIENNTIYITPMKGLFDNED